MLWESFLNQGKETLQTGHCVRAERTGAGPQPERHLRDALLSPFSKSGVFFNT